MMFQLYSDQQTDLQKDEFLRGLQHYFKVGQT